MSGDFNLQKDQKRTLELDIFDNDGSGEFNFDNIKDENFSGLDDDVSLNFTKEKRNSPKSKHSSIDSNIFRSQSNKKPSREKETQKTNVNIKKDNRKPSSTNFLKEEPNKKRKPVNEPNSIDLGLDGLANPSKKLVNKDDEVSKEEGSFGGIRGHISGFKEQGQVQAQSEDSGSGLGEFENVRDIMGSPNEENSEHSGSIEKNSNDNASELSGLIRDKIRNRSHLTENQRKEELLYAFSKLERKGFKLNQKFTMRSPLEDMECVYQRLEHERNLKNSIKFQRRVLMGIVSTLEFVNTSFNPFDIDLEGWSESVMENQPEYDDIFEELYEKYKDKGKISPEVKLLMTLAGSAFYFHLSKTIIRSGQQKMNEIFGASGGGVSGGANPLSGLMGGFMNNFMNAGANDNDTNVNANEGMKGPQGFDDILSNNAKGSDIPSIHSSDSTKKKKRTLKL
jgi:hypothetical protein